jgi:hypothetical protein
MSAESPAQVVWATCGPVVEVVAAVAGAGRPPEVVDRDRLDADLGESNRQLLVVVVQAADVRQDHDRLAGGLGGQAWKARNSLPSAAWRVSEAWSTAAPATRRDRRGLSRSKHMVA